jgi:pilus assembly protein Flp/PilA
MRFGLKMFLVRLKSLRVSEEGQDLVEYALIIALISVAAVTSLHGLASKITNTFNTIGSSL